LGNDGRGSGVRLLRTARLGAIAGIVAAALAAEAVAFDVRAHSDMTYDAFRADRYEPAQAQIAQIDGFVVDLYENAKANPLSGQWHKPPWPDNPFAEDWPDAVWRSADALHFDSTGGGHPESQPLPTASR
jgi:hypothetical protein